MATNPKSGKPAPVEVKLVRVRALETGYDNIAVRNPGDEFLMPEGATAPWFEPIVED